MAQDDSNIETLKWAYGHWAESQSVEAWLVIAADDIRIRSAADEYAAAASFGMAPAGKAGLRRYAGDMLRTWKMEMFEVRRYIADGDQVAALIDSAWRHHQTGRYVATPVANFWTFNADGKAVEMIDMWDTAAMVAAARPAE